MDAAALRPGNASLKIAMLRAFVRDSLAVSIATPTLIVTHKCFAKKERFGLGLTNAPNCVPPMNNVNLRLSAPSLTIAGTLLMLIEKIRCASVCPCTLKITVPDLAGTRPIGKILLSKTTNSMVSIAKQALLSQSLRRGPDAHRLITLSTMVQRLCPLTSAILVTMKWSAPCSLT